MSYGDISNSEDIMDSRDVISRMNDLQEIVDDDDSDPDDRDDAREELDVLKELAEEAGEYTSEWEDGTALIRDSYFTRYAEDMADDIGAIDRNATWPLSHIDWEAAADELKTDYTSVEFDGVTYWLRNG